MNGRRIVVETTTCARAKQESETKHRRHTRRRLVLLRLSDMYSLGAFFWAYLHFTGLPNCSKQSDTSTQLKLLDKGIL